MYQTDKTFQIKCEDCGHVTHTHGTLSEADRKCHKCGSLITEQNIQEVKGNLLLE